MKRKGFCPHCDVAFTKDNCSPFVLSRGYGHCRDCFNTAARLRYKKNPNKQKKATEKYLSLGQNKKIQHSRTSAWRRKQEFGITQDQFDKKFEKQKGLCAICGRSMKGEDRNRVPCQDHNHETGENRDLLCVSCNLMIGNSRESEEILANAIKYLKKWAVNYQ